MGSSSSDQMPRKRSLIKVIAGVLFLIIITVVGTGAAGYYWYNDNIKPVSLSQTTVIVQIPVGSTTPEIGVLLEEKQLIRSAKAFEWYVRLNNLRADLQAGTYELSPAQGVQEITTKLAEGVTTQEFVTILPAQRLDQIKDVFKDAGYSDSEIEIALRPDTYAGHPALVDVPAGKNLEGYLYPDTYLKTAETPLTDIVTLALDEFARYFTQSIIQSFQAQGLNPYEGLVISSIVEREVNNGQERKKVAQVFVKRFREGIMLGSDPTALYGALVAGIEPSVFADTPYNTRLYTGIPPTPINNVSVDSLEAVADPADTDFLFFVSGDDGVTRFSRTLEEHEALTAQYCIELCQSY